MQKAQRAWSRCVHAVLLVSEAAVGIWWHGGRGKAWEQRMRRRGSSSRLQRGGGLREARAAEVASRFGVAMGGVRDGCQPEPQLGAEAKVDARVHVFGATCNAAVSWRKEA